MGGKMQKKGKTGNVVKYITRNKALKKLQVSLQDFRRLCILKGVFPRDPKKKVHGTNKTYYLTKDIIFLSHEPLLQKFRDIRTHEKKIIRARGRRDFAKIRRLEKHAPMYTLDKVVLERYPTFQDALRDLNDALCMVHLFADQPANDKISTAQIEQSQELVRRWQLWVSKSQALRKVFFSVKGVYCEAEASGEKLVWLAPLKFSRTTPTDVDFRVLGSFLELYTTQLHFVLFRLFAAIGLQYPPKINVEADGSGAGILAAEAVPIAAGTSAAHASDDDKQDASASNAKGSGEISGRRDTVASVIQKSSEDMPEDDEQGGESDDEDDGDDQGIVSKNKRQELLKNVKVFVSREVPQDIVMMMLQSMGAVVGWQGEMSPFKETDEEIAIQIVDRDFQRHRYINREYVQPQWLADTLNWATKLPTSEYEPGVVAPDHLSPFVNNDAEGYLPERAKELAQLAGQDEEGEGEEASDMESDADDSGDEEAIGGDEIGQKQELSAFEAELRKEVGDEQAAEGASTNASVVGGLKKRSKTASKKDSQAERQRMMMPNKLRKVYDKLSAEEEGKKARSSALRSKAKALKKARS